MVREKVSGETMAIVCCCEEISSEALALAIVSIELASE